MSICRKLRLASLLLGYIVLTSCTTPELTKWPSSDITYSIDAIHLKGIDVIRANEIIHRAFKAWEVAGVNFTHMMHGQIKVNIKPLQGNQAGFGYFPPYGRLYLDSSDRVWSESLLYRVMLHEIGHCLGLRHSRHYKSVMTRSIPSFNKLGYWDIQNIKGLYGLPD